MREEQTHRSDDATSNGDLDRSGVPNGHHPNGFTAVNGEGHRISSFRPDESAKQYMPYQANGNHSPQHLPPINSSFHSHGWRPDDRQMREDASRTCQRDSSPSRKRKRSITVNVDDQGNDSNAMTDVDGRDSPKRRTTSTLDSAIDLTSPVNNMQLITSSLDRRPPEPAPIGPYQRERSPVARWNQGEPPPKPRPETAALLAESAHKFHRTQQSEEARQSRAPEEHERSSPAMDVDQQDGNASEEDSPQGDHSDPKKPRKRNFSNRTKTGCHTCRNRKKKCDERKPTCSNCERGNFACQGYGPKPPSGSKSGQVRQLMLPKGYAEGASAPGPYYQSPSEEAGLSYSHWGRVPASEHAQNDHGSRPYPESNSPDQRYPPPSSRDSWHSRPSWPTLPNGPPPSHFQDRFPAPDYPHSNYHYNSAHQPSLPPPPQAQHVPPPPISDPFAQYGSLDAFHRPSTNRAPTISSSHSGSNHTGGSQHAGPLALTMTPFQPSEKDKMLRGQPFLHWLDTLLIGERDSCSIAVDCYNKGSRSDKGLSREAKAGLFAQILDPAKRIHGGQRSSSTHQSGPSPVGTIKDHTIVESPFKCDYGYNIHLGSATVLQAGCHLQDAASITIGDRVIVGPDVKIHTLTASVDCGVRKGSQGTLVAGEVVVEDDVFIGANCIILPCCTIGRGAVVGAGSVVTRDVKENTVVAGNPAKFIRSIIPSVSNWIGVGVGSGLTGVDEVPVDRRHAYEIHERNERVKKRMVEFANQGFNRYSPRLI